MVLIKLHFKKFPLGANVTDNANSHIFIIVNQYS